MNSNNNEKIKIALINYSKKMIDLNRSIDDKIHIVSEIVDDNEIVQIITIDKKDFMNKSLDHIKPEGTLLSGTKSFLGEYLYQTIFEDATNIIKIDYDKLNNIGTQFTGGMETYKPLVLAKFKIIGDYEVDIVSLTKDNICEFLENRFVKKGVVLHENNKTDIYKYSQNHLDNFMEKFGLETVKQNFKYYEYKIFNMIFIIAEDIRQKETKELNKEASNITKTSIYGSVYCSLYYTPDNIEGSSYISIDEELCKKIIYLLQQNNFDDTNDGEFETITKDNCDEKMKIDKSQYVVSPKVLIERAYKKYSIMK